MNGKKNSTISILLLGIMASSTLLFAKESISVRLPAAAALCRVRIAAGQYRMSWESHSSEATVTLARDQEVVAKVEGRLVERTARVNRDAIIYQMEPDGSRSIVEIRLGDGKRALLFSH